MNKGGRWRLISARAVNGTGVVVFLTRFCFSNRLQICRLSRWYVYLIVLLFFLKSIIVATEFTSTIRFCFFTLLGFCLFFTRHIIRFYYLRWAFSLYIMEIKISYFDKRVWTTLVEGTVTGRRDEEIAWIKQSSAW